LSPECAGRDVVWNIRDPYFMDRENSWKVYEQIKEKVTKLTKSLLIQVFGYT
jgi:protein-tyrosine-phosphatase